ARESLEPHGFEQVVDGGELEGLERLVFIRRHEHQSGPVLEAAQGAREVEAREPRHVDVEEGGVDGALREQPHGLRSRGGAVHRRDAWLLPQQVGEFVERGRLVVGDEHRDAAVDHPASLPSLARSGCDLGTRIVTSVPAPMLVSTTSPKSSPYTCRRRVSTLRSPTCSPDARPASTARASSGSMPTPSPSTVMSAHAPASEAVIVTRPPRSVDSSPWR